MKTLISLSAMALAAAAALLAAEQTWTGKLLVRRSAADSPSKYAFIWDMNWYVYEIANQDFPGLARHRGHPITLTGELKSNAITVSKLEIPQPLARLQRLFPTAGAFSAEGGEPPHFKVYAAGSGRNAATPPIGFAFWTSDLVPDERGYYGPIIMLVGMDAAGILTGVIVVDHNEPYGRISVDRPAFAAQFTGKSIRAPFVVGRDVDAISSASITITSATRAIRDSARMVARRFLTPEAVRR